MQLDSKQSLIVPEMPDGYEGMSIIGQALLVSSGVETTILNHVVSALSESISSIEVSGTNKSYYTVLKNNVPLANKWTSVLKLSEEFKFLSYHLNTGDQIEIKVIHERPYTGDYSARIIGARRL